jgi:hypothetical protein
MEHKVYMIWLPHPTCKWLLHDGKKNRAMYDFWDCGSVRMIFQGLKKGKKNKYTWIVKEGW